MDNCYDLGAGARLTIDLDAIVANYTLIVGRAASARVAAVVKANAYGLGADRVGDVLFAAGCRDFFVAHVTEVPPLAPLIGQGARLFVLNGLPEGAERLCLDLGAVPVLNSLDQIHRWRAVAAQLGRSLPAAVQVDTGMARLGLSPVEVEALTRDPSLLDGIRVELLMSHLACADAGSDPANAAQWARFDRLSDLVPGARRSLANSGGAFLSPAFQYDLLRTGIALYGGSPIEDAPNPMRAVVRLEAPIVQTRLVPAGDGIGYGLTCPSPRDRRIATISVGYADGWPRRLGNRGSAYIGDVRVPIVGRVSMDSILLDVTDLAEDVAGPGSLVELLGDHQTIDDVARDADTIAYEILTQLGHRYARDYRPAQQAPLLRSVSA